MATYYWVGGAGTWNTSSTTNWATSSGTSGGFGPPTSADNVIIDDNSGTGTITCTNAVCNDITVTASQAITLGANASTLQMYGSMTLPSGGSFVFGNTNCNFKFRATTTGNTITTNGKLISAFLEFNGVGGEWTLGSALTFSGGAFGLVFTAGTLNTNNYNISYASIAFGAGSSAKTLNLGSSTVTLSGTTPLTFTTGAGFTFNAGTSTINCSAGSPTFAGGGFTFYNVAFTSSVINVGSISGANTFNNLTFTAKTNLSAGGFSFGANQTINGTLSVQSGQTDPTKRMLFASDTVGTQRTITASSIDFGSSIDFRDIVAAGSSAPWDDSTRSKYWGDCLGNTGITFNAGRTVYWNLAGSQNWHSNGWAATNNGTPNAQYFPLAQDTATFTEAGSAETVSTVIQYALPNIQMMDGVSNRVTPFTLATIGVQNYWYGNVTFFSGLILTGTNIQSLYGQSRTQTITSAGVTWTQPITINAPNGTLQLQDALTLGATRTFTHTAGTVDLNGKTLTVPVAYSTSNSNVRSINFGSGGIISLPGSGTAFNATNATNLKTSGTGRIDMTSASAKTFAGGGASYPMLNQGGAGALTVTGANTFQDILNTVRGASIVFPASTTTTVNNLSLNGSSGNLVAITSSVPGSKARIEKTSGQVGLQYCSLKDIQAQGGAKFRAPSNYGNTNVSGNAGWDFGTLNTTQDNFMFFFGDTIR